MDKLTYSKLRTITKIEDLPKTAKYYITKSLYKPSFNGSWYELYDENFKLIEVVKIHYTNVLENIDKIIENKAINRLFEAMYKTKKINENYSFVIEDDETAERLKAICNSLK